MLNACTDEGDKAKIFSAAFASMLTLCTNAIKLERDQLLTKYLREFVNALEVFQNPVIEANLVIELL